MNMRHIATLILSAAAAAAIGAAPSASAANIITGADARPNRVVIDTRPGNTEVQVEPPTVSDVRSYGQFSSPAPLLGD
jgi:hypothetical protein